MITATELAAMQSTLTSSLPDTCTIRRATPSADGLGGQTVVWANLATVACRIGPMPIPAGRAEGVDAGRATTIGQFLITVPTATDVTPKDRIVSGTHTFEVLDSTPPRSWELCIRLSCQEVT